MKFLIILLTIGTLSFGQTFRDKKVGEKIEGNFFGKSYKITATYEIQFSNTKLEPIKAGCCKMILVNEGDLNHDGSDEISVYQAPMNGCSYSMTTYSFINGKWEQIVKPFLIPTGCSELSNAELQSRIFLKDKKIYYYKTVSDEDSGKFSLKKVLVK